MLSDKAKGKQRAVETLPDVESTTEIGPSESRNLIVRFTEGIPDLVLSIQKQDSVRDVKKHIRDTRPELKNRRLRLIQSGRLLTDGTYLYSWLESLEERQQRAIEDNGQHAAKSSTTWIHCSVGPQIEPGKEDNDEGRQEDIANFRRQFHNQSAANYLDVEFETEDEYDEHARALEEQWIDSMDNAGTASLSQLSSSSNSSVLQGVLLGFFFPLLPFFFMRSQKPAVFWDDENEQEPTANVVFSRPTQMGLVVGFLVNVLFGLWRFLLDSS
ncbi:DUF2407 ubiquitin-like domain-containing protein [Cyathus striatus]|nr:DUF2407 ubiquitin-like domain-containing protein [Cyathus striatus]